MKKYTAFINDACAHIRHSEYCPMFPLPLRLPFTLNTVCPSIRPLSLLYDHSDPHLITDLPPSDNFFCTPSPLVSKFSIPLCPSTYLVIHGEIFDKYLQPLYGWALKGLPSLLDQILVNIIYNFN